ncbi:MAG: aldo/keto reductase [Marinibacterium sp.]
MKTTSLGRTGLAVSELSLGTMTFGTQTPQDDAHRQMDAALAAGINLVDTAEMYPVNPVRKETVGLSESILGAWNRAHPGRRADYILATKVSGEGLAAVRDGAPISPDTIRAGVEGSLKRLGTDYIDLYQLHWPNRGSYMFRQNWTYAPTARAEEVRADIESCLGALQDEVDRGTIRAIGLSNESAWGTAQWLRLSEDGKGPRVASIQNEYSLLCRLYDTDLAELSLAEDVGLLAFSPLATGLLTGKYQGGALPDGSRRTLSPGLGGRATDHVWGAVDAYLAIARRHGLHPVHMALAWCRTRPFMASAIFGATTFDQLEVALGAADVDLGPEVLADIDAAHRAHPMPY